MHIENIVPTAPPLDVTGVPIDSRSIRVEWSPPPKDRHNGPLTKYVIKYQKVPDKVILKNPELLKHVFPETMQSTSYSQQQHPSLSPSSILPSSLPSFASSSSSSLHPSNPLLSSNVKVFGSPVRLRIGGDDDDEEDDDNETESSSRQPVVREQTVESTQRYVVLKDLEEWTSYRITVAAATKVGLGPASSEIFVRTDESGMFSLSSIYYLLLCLAVRYMTLSLCILSCIIASCLSFPCDSQTFLTRQSRQT